MRNKLSKGGSVRSRSFRYGTVSTILSVVLIAAIILVNVIFSMLAEKYTWYLDMTKAQLFSVSDACIEALSAVTEDVTIYFCDEKDNLEADTTQSYVHHTALELAEKMPNIHIEYIDIWSNPTAVDKFKRGEEDPIYSTSVIVESGSEWRTYQLRAFYTFNSADSTTPWAYSGEMTFSSAILAVTKADSPIACITATHGESFTEPFYNLLITAGYQVQEIDLLTQDIPEDCRLMIINNPKEDFLVKEEGISDISEIAKLDKFLNGLNALMVFMSPDTDPLPHLEEYLEEWGIKFLRNTNQLGETYSCKVSDASHTLTEDGLTIVGEYTTAGLGASIHTNMRKTGVSPKVVFRNSMPIVYSDVYDITTYLPDDAQETTESTAEPFTYGSYTSSASVNREIYDVFTSYDSATVMAEGNQVGSAAKDGKYRLMTVTREQRMIDNTNADASYVWACGTTDFISESFLNSNTYGNSDLLLYSLHTMGKAFVPVELDYKIFDNTTIEGLTTEQADQYTWSLILVPPIIIFAVGTTVIVRRKYS